MIPTRIVQRLLSAFAIAVLLAPMAASADVPFPLIAYNSNGSTTYDPGTGQFLITATPLSIRTAANLPPTQIDAPASLTIAIFVDQAGALSGGVPGPDVTVTGTLNGMTSTLLEGEVTDFASQDTGGTTDLFDLVVSVTGGTLAGDYASGIAAIAVTSEQSDFIGSFEVEFSGEAKGTISQLPGAGCDLVLDKTCLVVSATGPDLECQAKIVAMRLRYIGPSLGGISDVQIVGRSDATASYSVELNQNVTVLEDQNGFSIDATESGENDLGSKTSIFINGVEEVIHTSCSAPVVVGQPAPLDDPKGDPSPNWLVEAFIDADGNDVALPDPQYADSCEIDLFTGAECDQRPTAILYRYTAGDCTTGMNVQDPDKVDCEDLGPLTGPVRIVVRKDSNVYADESGVEAGDVVEATAANAGRDEFDSEVTIDILDAGGNVLQHLRMHTSCSQPLRLGDRFGALEIAGFVNDEQGTVLSGAEILYQYEITNNGPDAVLNVVVNDTSLTPPQVPGSPIDMLAAGATEILNASAFVEAATSGFTTVTGETASGATCADHDETPIDIALPPPCEVAGDGFELKDDAFKWDIDNIGANMATIESIAVSWPAPFGAIKEIKLNGKIVDSLIAPSSALIDTFVGDIDDRQIEPGMTETLEIKFVERYKEATPDEFMVTVNFAEGCSITFEPGQIPFGGCEGKIRELTMIWDGTVEPVTIKAYAGDPTSDLLFTSGDLTIGSEVTVGGYTAAGAPNDVHWEIFNDAGTKIGESKFHRSCSDDEMDGAEDCGARQGNGKGNDDGFVNDWLLEGLVDEEASLDCSALP